MFAAMIKQLEQLKKEKIKNGAISNNIKHLSGSSKPQGINNSENSKIPGT